RLDAPLQLAQLGLARLHPGLELGELRPLLVGGGTADGGGGAAALGRGRFGPVAGPPGSHVELEDLVGGGRLVLELRPPAEVVGVIAQGLERDHASASASPVGRVVGRGVPASTRGRPAWRGGGRPPCRGATRRPPRTIRRPPVGAWWGRA